MLCTQFPRSSQELELVWPPRTITCFRRQPTLAKRLPSCEQVPTSKWLSHSTEDALALSVSWAIPTTLKP